MATQIPKDKLNQFLKQAKDILAGEGSLNAGAMSKIFQAGKRHGFSSKQIDKAVAMLSERNEAREGVFRNLVYVELQKEKQVSPRLKHKLIACARLQLSIKRQIAVDIIEDVARSKGVPVVSDQEAKTQLETHIRQSPPVGEPDPTSMQSLYSTAHRLGMDRKHVENAIYGIQEHAIETRKKTWFYGTLIVAPLLLIGVGLGIWAMNRGPEEPGQNRFASKEKDQGKDFKKDKKDGTKKDNGDPPTIPPDATLWSNVKGFETALEEVKKQIPEEKATFEKLRSKEEAERLLAQQHITLNIADLYDHAEARPHLVTLLAGMFAGEASDTNSKEIGDWLVSKFPKQSDKIASTAAANFERRLWFSDVAVASIYHPSASAERRNSLCKGLESRLEERIDPNIEEKALKDGISSTMCERLLKNVLVTSQEDPNLALDLSDELSKVAKPFLPDATRLDAEADLLMAVLNQPNVDPKRVKPRLARHFPTFDSEMKRAVLTSYRKAPKAMGDAIEPILTSSVDAHIEPGMTQEQKADAMLAVLEHRSQFLNIAVARSKAATAQPDKLLPILQESLNLAHASTVGCALAFPIVGQTELAGLLKKSPVLGVAKKKEEKPKKDNGATQNPTPVPTPLPAASPLIRGTLFGGSNTHRYPMVAGQRYRIDMTAIFDTYLRLEDPLGRYITANDDGGLGLNSRIYFTCPRSGPYRIVAMSYRGRGRGSYTIFVRPSGFRGFPPPVPIPGAPLPGMPIAGQPNQKVEMDQLLPFLIQLNSRVPNVRSSAFQQIASKFKGKLNPTIAGKLAKYLLEFNQAQEFKSKVQSLRSSDLRKSRELKIALVDHIGGKAKLYQNNVENVYSAMLEKDVEFQDKENWRSESRKFMLRHVIEKIEEEGLPPADETAKKLRELYKKQGEIMGMDVSELAKTSDPGATLAKLVQHLAAHLQTERISDEDKKMLSDVQQKMLIAEAAARGDLEKTVLLQRQWLRLLTVFAASRQPSSAKQIRAIPVELAAADEKAKHILTQLRDGEAHILRVWRLLHEPN